MSSQESDNIYIEKYRVTEQLTHTNNKLEEVEAHLLKQLRSQGFICLRRGVSAVEHSVKLWAERSLS